MVWYMMTSRGHSSKIGESTDKSTDCYESQQNPVHNGSGSSIKPLEYLLLAIYDYAPRHEDCPLATFTIAHIASICKCICFIDNIHETLQQFAHLCIRVPRSGLFMP